MNSSSNSTTCEYQLRDCHFPEWRPNLLSGDTYAVLISVTILNPLLSPLTKFVNILVILAVKTTPQLRDKYNVLLACLAGTDIMNGALG